MPVGTILLVVLGGGLLLLIAAATHFSGSGSLDNIKSKTVGDGQHGTARWAEPKEIKRTYAHVPFRPAEWRGGKNLPAVQGLVLGSAGKKHKVTALVDGDDIHCLMIGASGVGKTAYFLYPNLEYACASGMSFLCLDTKGDLARNYGGIAQDCYGYQVSVVDLRNPTRSDGSNFLTLVNRYMDKALADPQDIASRAKAEKYAKILAKTIISPDGDSSKMGQNAYFYDAAEGLLTAVILLLAEFLPPKEIDGEVQERRHIVSVFKLVQDLLEPSQQKGKLDELELTTDDTYKTASEKIKKAVEDQVAAWNTETEGKNATYDKITSLDVKVTNNGVTVDYKKTTQTWAANPAAATADTDVDFTFTIGGKEFTGAKAADGDTE